MTHDCSFELDKDGQVTCLVCGAMAIVTPPYWAPSPYWGGTTVSFEE